MMLALGYYVRDVSSTSHHSSLALPCKTARYPSLGPAPLYINSHDIQLCPHIQGVFSGESIGISSCPDSGIAGPRSQADGGRGWSEKAINLLFLGRR